MTKKEILEMTGLSEEEFYAQYPTQKAFQKAMGGMVDEYKKGGWIQKATASIKRRGTEGVCTGSKFGGPTCRPGTKRYNLAKTFRKMAKSRKEEGGYVDMYEEGGMVDAYQLMGMPTPEMYEPGGKVRRRYKSPDRTDDNLSVIRSKSTDNLNLPDEYAASYDPNSLNLGIVDAKRYNRALGLDYNKSFGPFTAGIRGGVNKETTPTLYQKKGTRYEKVKEGEAKNILFGGLYGRVGTSIAPDLDTNTEVISFNPSLEVGLDKYGNSTKPYYDASVDVGFLNNMGSIGGGYTNRRQPYAVSLPSEGAGQESYPYAGASLNVPIVRDREGNPRLTVAGGYNIPLSKNTPDSGYAGLTYGFGKGGLIKRKDGSYSRRGLWDNIRANRGSGKKPTKEMLKQERKIRAAEKKEYGGMVNMYGMGGTTNMSHVISAKNFPNMGYAMGGPVMYKKGGFLTGLGDFGLAMADTVTSVVNPDIIGADSYSDTGFGKTMKGVSDVTGGITNAAAPIVAGAIGGPIASAAVGAAQNMSKQFVPQQQDTSTTRQIGNMFGSLAPLGGAIYAASAGSGSGSGSTTTGTPHAMGGPINYPEGYQKNITFAMGGNVDMTTGELEHGENLNVYRNGRWKTVTKYESGGMGRHNADGTPKPAQEVALPFGGSIASRLYQKEDDLAEATNDRLHKEALHGKVITAKSGGYVRDSYANGGPVNGELRFPGRIEWTKRKKEAKEEAMAMKKYGGAIKRMFAKGGMVPMYDLGGGTGGLNTNNPAFGSYNLPSSFSQDLSTPVAGPLWNAYGRPSQFNMNNLFQGIPPQTPTPGGLPLPTPLGKADNLGFNYNMSNYLNTMRQQGIRNNQDVDIPTMARSGFDADGNPVSINPNAPSGYIPSGFESMGTNAKDMSNFDKYAPYAMQGLPIAWNLMQAMKKPTKVPGTLGAMSTALEAPKMSGEAGRRALAREGAAARYAWRQAGAQAGPAALTALTNTRMGRIADFEEGLRNAQAQMDYQAAAQRKAYEQFNAQQAMNRYMLQSQADAVPTQYASKGMEQLGQMGESMLNRQLLKQLGG